jgi:hypothetical protein
MNEIALYDDKNELNHQFVTGMKIMNDVYRMLMMHGEYCIGSFYSYMNIGSGIMQVYDYDDKKEVPYATLIYETPGKKDPFCSKNVLYAEAYKSVVKYMVNKFIMLETQYSSQEHKNEQIYFIGHSFGSLHVIFSAFILMCIEDIDMEAYYVSTQHFNEGDIQKFCTERGINRDFFIGRKIIKNYGVVFCTGVIPQLWRDVEHLNRFVQYLSGKYYAIVGSSDRVDRFAYESEKFNYAEPCNGKSDANSAYYGILFKDKKFIVQSGMVHIVNDDTLDKDYHNFSDSYNNKLLKVALIPYAKNPHRDSFKAVKKQYFNDTLKVLDDKNWTSIDIHYMEEMTNIVRMSYSLLEKEDTNRYERILHSAIVNAQRTDDEKDEEKLIDLYYEDRFYTNTKSWGRLFIIEEKKSKPIIRRNLNALSKFLKGGLHDVMEELELSDTSGVRNEKRKKYWDIMLTCYKDIYACLNTVKPLIVCYLDNWEELSQESNNHIFVSYTCAFIVYNAVQKIGEDTYKEIDQHFVDGDVLFYDKCKKLILLYNDDKIKESFYDEIYLLWSQFDGTTFNTEVSIYYKSLLINDNFDIKDYGKNDYHSLIDILKAGIVYSEVYYTYTNDNIFLELKKSAEKSLDVVNKQHVIEKGGVIYSKHSLAIAIIIICIIVCCVLLCTLIEYAYNAMFDNTIKTPYVYEIL